MIPNMPDVERRYLANEMGLNLDGTAKSTACVTPADMVEHHAEIERRTPVSTWVGPLMMLGATRWPRLTKLVSRFSFWLLKKAGWKLYSSMECNI